MNTNCLAGMQCPNCKSNGPFIVEVTTTVLLHDDGTEDYGDKHWNESSYMSCPECDHEGQAGEFYLSNQIAEKSEIQTFADAILRVVSGQTEEQ